MHEFITPWSCRRQFQLDSAGSSWRVDIFC